MLCGICYFLFILVANGQFQQGANSFGFVFDDNADRPFETSQKLNLHVEVLICTDYSVYKLHKEILRDHLSDSGSSERQLVTNHIKAYYEQVIDGVNDRYKMSFNDDQYLSIHVNVVDFFISTSPDDSPWSESPKYSMGYNDNGIKIINSHDVLIDFNSWLESSRDSFANFDHSFAVTAYDIRGNDTNKENHDYNGLGYIAGICRPYFSGSLIEERGAYTSTRSFAHEMGHNIGAEHDENTECGEWDNYLMASNFHSYNRNNSWVFSPCSMKAIKSYLNANHACLLNKPNSNKEFSSYIKLYPGQIYNPFEQCKQLYGPNALPCFEFKASICETLYCRKHIFDSECHWIAPAAEGTSCENNKWCQLGQCVHGVDAQNSDCFGDTVIWLEGSYEKKAHSCQGGIELLARRTGMTLLEICEEHDSLCCKTCERIRAYLTSSIKYDNEKNELVDSKVTDECGDDNICNMAYGNNYCRKRHRRKNTPFNGWCDRQCEKCY